jgi:hypothetical protein
VSNSTNIIGDLKTVAAAAPTSQSLADSIAAAGPITDLIGMINTCLVKAQELKNQLTAIKAASDSGDSNYFTTVNNIIGTLGS